MRWGKDALLIVHLSSLDSFYFHGSGQCAFDLAAGFISDIQAADDKGWPIFVLDRRWPCTDRSMQPRMEVLEALDDVYDYVWLGHDEGKEAWGPRGKEVIDTLVKVLRVFGVKNVLVSGGWYDPEVRRTMRGCAWGVIDRLRKAGFFVNTSTMISMEDADYCRESEAESSS